MTTPRFDCEATCCLALIQQSLDVGTAVGSQEVSGRRRAGGMVGSVPQVWSEAGVQRFQSTETYRDHPAAGYGRQPGGTPMAGPAASTRTGG